MKLLFQMNFDKKHPVADFDTLYLGPKGGKDREWGKGSHPGRAIDWYSSKGVLARHRHASNLDNYKKVTWNLELIAQIFDYYYLFRISFEIFLYHFNNKIWLQ